MPPLSSCFNLCQTYKFFNFWSKDQLTKKKDRILIKDLISNNLKYKAKDFTVGNKYKFLKIIHSINSCQIFNFCKIAICQDDPFCHLICIFGHTLDEFLTYSPFLPKFPLFDQSLPFSYNRHLSRFPSLSPHLRFCQTFNRFLANSPFSPICHFRENCQLPLGLFRCLI